jgi:hypothetical protein
MAICLSDSIKVYGRALSLDDMFDLPDSGTKATCEQHILIKCRKSRKINT